MHVGPARRRPHAHVPEAARRPGGHPPRRPRRRGDAPPGPGRGPRSAAGRDRRRALRPARRGVARHVGVLHLADRDLAAADRGAGLLVHRRRGRLARLLSRQSLREGLRDAGRRAPTRCCTRSSAGRPGCGRIARSSSSSSGCARTTRRAPRPSRSASTGSTSTRLWDSMHAVIGLPRARRSGARAAGAPGVPLLRAVRRGRPGVRARDGARADVVRGRGRRRARASCARKAPTYRRRRTRGLLQRRAERARRARTPSSTTARWSAAARRRGTCATATWSRRSTGCMQHHGPAREGDRLGAQHAHRRRPVHRHGARRDGQRRPARARGARATTDVVLVGFGTHRGTVIAADEWGAPMERMRVPPARAGQLRGDAARRRRRRRAAALRRQRRRRRRRARRAARPSRDRRRLRSRRTSGGATTCRRSSRGATTRSSILDETRAVDPLHMPVRVDGELPETYPSGM